MKIKDRLCFSTLICPDYSLNEIKETCLRFGLRGAELRLTGDFEGKVPDGLKITDIASSIRLTGYNGEQLESVKRTLMSAEKGGIGAVRFFLGNFRQRYSDPVKDIDYNGIVSALKELCDSTKCEIWIETHNEFATGRALKKLMEDVSKENIKIIWDVMHPFEDGETPEETFSYIKDYTAHVHIKDGKNGNDPSWHDFEYTPLGKGEVPIREITELLEGGGYGGCYSLEWENMWRPELKGLGLGVDEILTHFVGFMRDLE